MAKFDSSDFQNLSKSDQAQQILEATNDDVRSLFRELKADGVHFVRLRELLDRIQDDIEDALQRAVKEKIRIGVLGGRGSGKSTLANALMGAELLPNSAIISCTSIPTTIQYRHGQYSIQIDSELEKHSFPEKNLDEASIREILYSVCTEPQNKDNIKKVSKIVIGAPQGILDGKEIVDVPGFTRGHPLHQEYAESYAKYYCDVSLVLVNNTDSVEIRSIQGLEALAKTFERRLNSTIFVINKCDESHQIDIEYIHKELQEHLKGEKITVFRISARNVLKSNGDPYDYPDLLGHLSRITYRKSLVLVGGLLDRLIANFNSVTELCDLSADKINALSKKIHNFIKDDFGLEVSKLKKGLEKEDILPDEIPEIDLSEFDLPHPMGNPNPYEYGKLLVESMKSQSDDILDGFIQTHQIKIFRAFNEKYTQEVGKFNKILNQTISDFVEEFGIKPLIQTPEVENKFQLSRFKHSKIERLKPSTFRVWLEKKLPGFLVRDVKFWLSPISIKVGPIGIKIGIPVGVEGKDVVRRRIQKNVPEQALRIMNEYLYDTLDKFVYELDKQFASATDQFVREWRTALRDYKNRIELAQAITEPNSLKKIEEFVDKMKSSSDYINTLMELE